MKKLLLIMCLGSAAIISTPAKKQLALAHLNAETITSIKQADALVRKAQEQFIFLFPPTSDKKWIYVHPDQSMHPVIWSSRWPNKLKKQLYAEMRTINGNLYPVYKLWAEADKITGDLTYYNTFGQAVWTSPAPQGYTPLSPILKHYKLSNIADLSKSQQKFSASSIGLEFQLIPEEFLISYEQDAALEQQTVMSSAEPMVMSTMSIPLPGDDTSTNTGGGGSYQTTSIDYGDNLYIDQNLSLDRDGWLDIHNAEIGQEYEIYYTYNLVYRKFDTNLNHSSTYTAWPAKVGLIGNGDEVAYWSAPMISENGIHRQAGFFKAFSSEDSDGDGLSDIYELIMTKTDPHNPVDYNGTTLDGDVDQDGDGFSNREEYLGLGTDTYTHPRDNDTDNDGKSDDIDPWPMDYAGKVDTDGDRMPDNLNGTSSSYPMLVADPDDDNDRFSDIDEASMGTDSTDANSPGASVFVDSDADGLFDREDPYPNNPDGDGDGIGDGYEVKVLQKTATSPNSYSQAEKDAYSAVAGDADSDTRPQWAENRDTTNPIDGLDFKVSIF